MKVVFEALVVYLISSQFVVHTASFPSRNEDGLQILKHLSRAVRSTNDRYVQLTTVNEMIDWALDEIKLAADPSVPFNINNQSQSSYPVTMDMWNTKMYNMSDMHRASDIIIQFDTQEQKMTINLTVDIYNSTMISDYKATVKVAVLPVKSQGLMTANMPISTAKISLTLDCKHINITLDSMKLSVPNHGMDVKLSGNPEGKIANAVMPVITDMISGSILENFSNTLQDQFNDLIQRALTGKHDSNHNESNEGDDNN